MKCRNTSRSMALWACLAAVPAVLAEGGAPVVSGEAARESKTLESAEVAPESPGQLPRWLKLGAEFRTRAEFTRSLDFEPDSQDNYLLNHIRFDAGVAPNSWLRFYVQGQNASAPGFRSRADLDSVANTLDLRQAYVEFGRPEEGSWGVRLGRQELSFGDERLISSDGEWDNLGRTFDAVRVSYRKSRARLDAFASWLVNCSWRRLDRPETGRRLSGLQASFTGGPGSMVIEPYLFWKSSRNLAGESFSGGHHDVYTPGVRMAGDLPGLFDYNSELAFQRGHRIEDRIAAWASHWELGRRLSRAEEAPRALIEYNFASGDGRPNDGRRNTFDDLLPAGYNAYGTLDPIAWVNIHQIAGGLEWRPGRRWKLNLGYRSFWLANREDCLYPDAETCMVRDPAAPSSHVGSQALLMAGYESAAQWQLSLGYARFFLGAFLRHASYEGALSTPYVMWNYRF